MCSRMSSRARAYTPSCFLWVSLSSLARAFNEINIKILYVRKDRGCVNLRQISTEKCSRSLSWRVSPVSVSLEKLQRQISESAVGERFDVRASRVVIAEQSSNLCVSRSFRSLLTLFFLHAKKLYLMFDSYARRITHSRLLAFNDDRLDNVSMRETRQSDKKTAKRSFLRFKSV